MQVCSEAIEDKSNLDFDYRRVTVIEKLLNSLEMPVIAGNHTFSYATYSPRVDTRVGSMRERLYRDFIKLRIRENLGFTWKTWLQEPYDEVMWQIKTLRETTKWLAEEEAKRKAEEDKKRERDRITQDSQKK